MGVIITARRDGFRRGGIAHSAAGKFYPNGFLTEDQLKAFRSDPQLVVTEQAEAFSRAGQDESLLGEMGTTIAVLEHELEQARAGLTVASADLLAALGRQQAAPGLVVEEAKLLVQEDPTKDGVICILPDNLAALIAAHLQPQNKTPEAQDDGHKSTLGSAGDSESPPNPAPVSAMAPAVGPDPEPMKADKPAGKRGGSTKAEQKGKD